MVATAVTLKDLEVIRQEGLDALKQRLGVVGMIKFLQMYSDGQGDTTADRAELVEDVGIDEIIGWLDSEETPT